jgi:hypothetical protein
LGREILKAINSSLQDNDYWYLYNMEERRRIKFERAKKELQTISKKTIVFEESEVEEDKEIFGENYHPSDCPWREEIVNGRSIIVIVDEADDEAEQRKTKENASKVLWI